MQSTTKPLNSVSAYSPLSFSNSISTSASTDQVLVVVSMNHKSTDTNSFLWLKLHHSNGSSINPLTVSVSNSAEEQSANFFFLDKPDLIMNAQPYTFSYKGSGILGSNNQMRRFDAISFPASYPIYKSLDAMELTISTSDYISMNIQSDVTVTNSNQRVLLLFTGNYQAITSSQARFTLYKDGNILQTGLILQKISSNHANKYRQVTFAYVDNPGIGNYTYTPMVSKENPASGNFFISENNRNYRSLTAIVLSQSDIKMSSSVNPLVYTSTSITIYSSILNIPITLYDQTATQVLIIVNLNFCPTSDLSSGFFTIYRDEYNLAINTANTNTDSLLKIFAPESGECSSASMTFLDTPSSIGTYTYSARVRWTSGDFTLGAGGQHYSITAVTMPQAFVAGLAVINCIAGCNLSGANYVDGPVTLAQLTLPPTFTIQFAMIVAALPVYDSNIGDVPNFQIFSVVDNNNDLLLAVGLRSDRSVKLYYNGTIVLPSSVQLVETFTTSFTTFTIDVMQGLIRISSSVDPGWIQTVSVPTTLDTTGKTYMLHANSLAQGGIIEAISITGINTNR